jgi:hypothetical protein
VAFPKPQLSGSFADPSIQFSVSEFDGSAQTVKSALICVSALLPGFEQRAVSAMMSASLSACWAYQMSIRNDLYFSSKKKKERKTYTSVSADGP